MVFQAFVKNLCLVVKENDEATFTSGEKNPKPAIFFHKEEKFA